MSIVRHRVLSGIRATGRLHLGNYLGAVKGMLTLSGGAGSRFAGQYETLYMIADLHTMTTPFDPKTLRATTLQVVLDYLACGLDPKKSAIFVQSDLADLHAQLMFYFSTVVSVARMQHLPTFKDKVKQYPHHVNMALLNYPVLMAADILIYKASAVPVGIDQEPHLEVAREIARRMNDVYGTDFPEPTRFTTEAPSVPSLTGEGKMSKSVENSYINLTDDLLTIKKRLAAVPTDSGRGVVSSRSAGRRSGDLTSMQIATSRTPRNDDRRYISNDRESHGVEALLQFVELFQGKKRRAEYEKQYTSTGIRYGDLKKELAEAIYKELEPIQKRRKEFERNPKLVEEILKDGAARARKIAEETISEVRKRMGLI